MDTFFDIMNVKNVYAQQFERKSNLVLFSFVNDPRFSWLRNVFLQYFKDWLYSVEERQGNFTQNTRQKNFILWQTHEGLNITVNSVIEEVHFLLQHEVNYVLPECLCQDPLENYFGHRQSAGARNDNTTIHDVGYNDNTIRNQKVHRPIAGNVNIGPIIFDFTNESIPC